MKRTYEIHPRPANLGGGWKLTLLEDGEEAGGGAFPVTTDDSQILAEAYNEAMEEGESWIGDCL